MLFAVWNFPTGGSDLQSFFFQSSQFPEPFTIVRDLFSMHHRVMVTRSSTCTSLTSCLEKQNFCHSTVGNREFVDEAKEFLLLGYERGLMSGLIWVAISLFKTAWETEYLIIKRRRTIHVIQKPTKTNSKVPNLPPLKIIPILKLNSSPQIVSKSKIESNNQSKPTSNPNLNFYWIQVNKIYIILNQTKTEFKFKSCPNLTECVSSTR